jgi:hypothetical protein
MTRGSRNVLAFVPPNLPVVPGCFRFLPGLFCGLLMTGRLQLKNYYSRTAGQRQYQGETDGKRKSNH